MHKPEISPYLENPLWVQSFYTYLILSHFSTDLKIEEEKSKFLENFEAVVETLQALSIRETFTIKSADKE